MQDDKTRQKKYKVMLKDQGLKLLTIPLPERDIELAMQLTNAPKERAALTAIFNIGLGRQQDLLNNFETDKTFNTTERDKLMQECVTANELIATLTTERDKLIQESVTNNELIATLTTERDNIMEKYVTANELIATITAEHEKLIATATAKHEELLQVIADFEQSFKTEFAKLRQEIADYERDGKQWKKNQRILAKMDLLETLQPNAPPIHAAPTQP